MAIQNDYFMRIIEEFGYALRRLLARREQQTYDDFEYEIQRACRECAGIEFEFVRAIPCDQLLDLLRVAERVRPFRYLVLGDLLMLDAAALLEEGRNGEVAQRYQRALLMYLAGSRLPHEDVRSECSTKVDDLAEELAFAGLPDLIQHMLLDHYESLGRFYEIERLLLDATDTNDAAMLERGRAFYRRLLMLPEDLLQPHGMSHEDARRGLRRMDEQIGI